MSAVKSAVKLEGKKVADEFLRKAQKYVASVDQKPKLATILCGDDEASEIYVNIKKNVCTSTGIEVEVLRPSPDEILDTIKKLNNDPKVTGILVQLPLPDEVDENQVAFSISPEKDVDGANPENKGKLFFEESMPPCTPFGIVKILEKFAQPISGKTVAIIGRSLHIGMPLLVMLTRRDATVTLCHSKTKDLSIIKNADIVVTAVGKPGFLKGSMIKKGAVVIDVGITRVGKKVVGDVDMDSVKNEAYFVTPVPGGVGPVTVAMLVNNIVNAHRLQNNYDKK